MWARVRTWLAAFAVGAAALFYLLWQYARTAVRDARQQAREDRERAATCEALRQLERDVQASRKAVQERARENAQELERREAADDRPAVFGDQRLHDRQNRLRS